MDYNKRTTKPYNGNGLYSQVYDCYFDDLNACCEFLDDLYDINNESGWNELERTPAAVCEFAGLHVCEPEYLQPPDFHEIDLPDWVDQLDVPEDIAQKLQDLQHLVEQRKHILWYEPTQYRPDPETL